MYLLDTNVLSELRKGTRADPLLRAFFSGQDESRLYLPVQTIGEIQGGIGRLRQRNDQKQAQVLEHWLYLVIQQYHDRILHFDIDCAQMWGSLMSNNQHNPIDKQIAAIALIHDLTVLTRNSRDFSRLPVKWHNSFDGTSGV